LRTARKSAGGFGNFSDGGFGGAMLAHAVRNSGAAIASAFRAGIMLRKQTTRRLLAAPPVPPLL
jgi:hypothetical protein